jgi:hypothetical protein
MSEENKTPFPVKDIAHFFGTEVQEIDPGLLMSIDADDPRAKRKVKQNFLENIRENGQLVPGLVYPDGEGKFFVIAGTQRANAIRQLKREGKAIKFKALVADQKLVSVGQLTALIAVNEAVVPMTGMEKAFWIVKLQKATNASNSEIARRIGVDEATVRNAKLLIASTDQMKQAIDDGIITETTALGILKETKDNVEAQVKKVNEARKKYEEKQASLQVSDSKKKEPKTLSAAELQDQKPTTGRLKRLAGAKGVPPAAALAFQLAAGEITHSDLKATAPWYATASAALDAEDAEKANAEKTKAETKEQEKARREAEKAAKKAEKDAEKARIAAMSEEEKKAYQAQKKIDAAKKTLEALQNKNPNASASKLAEKKAGKPISKK